MKLPRYLVVTPRSFEFKECPKGKDTLAFLQECIGCNYIEMILTVPELQGIQLYGDENGGLHPLKPFNPMVNPFIEEHTLLCLSVRTGPFGTYVLYSEKGLSRKSLEAACKNCNDGDDDPDPLCYYNRLQEAIKDYHGPDTQPSSPVASKKRKQKHSN